MRLLSFALFTAAGIMLSGPAFAKNSQKFESTISTPVTSVKVEVVLSEDLAWRAKNLPRDWRERGPIRRLNDGFAGNGFYGERDLNRLVERIERKMESRLNKYGVPISENAPQTIRITLTDARPNRPTFAQLSKSSVSRKSFATGGATLEGELVTTSGESNGRVSYAWYDNDILDAYYSGTWSDANRAIDRFATRTAKSLNRNNSIR